jgi:DNA (cytosine-5)-methyltransferase 1
VRGGSLFSGIGGFELAAELAGLGVEWRWQVEIDEACREVLAARFPSTYRGVVDVREASASTLAPVDIIVGGFPCQGISAAGKGKGLADDRSGLWREYARVVRELRPRYVVVENSTYLVSRGLDQVVADLVALGYCVEWECVPASAVGAPHRRDRIWIVAYADGDSLRDVPERCEQQPSVREDAEPVDVGARRDASDADSVGRAQVRQSHEPRIERAHGYEPDRRAGAQPPSDTPSEGLERWRQGLLANCGRRYWESVAPPEPTLCRVDDGVSARVDGPFRRRRRRENERLKQLGNAIVPQCAAVALRVVRALESCRS